MASAPPNMCSVAGCPEKAMMGGQPCDYCRQRQCVSHLLPEKHGCREAAKNAAKMFATKDAADVLRAKRDHDTQEAREKMAKRRAELAAQRSKKK